MSNQTRVFVRPLPEDIRKQEIEDVFGKFGRLRDIKVLRGYGFVEYEDGRDAADAVRDLDNTTNFGDRLAVEMAKEKRWVPPMPNERDRRSFGDRGDRGGRGGYRDRLPPRQGGGHRVLVSNVPTETSWHELKDFARDSNLHCHYAAVNSDGSAVLEFNTRDEMNRAIDDLQTQPFKGENLRMEEDVNYKPPAPRFDRGRGGFDRGGRGGFRGGFDRGYGRDRGRGGGFRGGERYDRDRRGGGGYRRDSRDDDYRRDDDYQRDDYRRERSRSPRRDASPPRRDGSPPRRDQSPPRRSRSPAAPHSPNGADGSPPPEDNGTW